MQQKIQLNQDAAEPELDVEWLKLILEAKKLGIPIEEVAAFFKQGL